MEGARSARSCEAHPVAVYTVSLQLHRRWIATLFLVPLLGLALAQLPSWASAALGIAWFVLFFASFLPREVELSVARGVLIVRRNGREIRRIEDAQARLLPYHVGTTGRTGSVLEIRGRGGRLRISAHGHTPSAPDRYEGSAVSWMDGWTALPSALDEILHGLRGDRALLALEPERARGHQALEIPVLLRPTSPLATLRVVAVSFAPLVTMALVGAVAASLEGPDAEVPTWAAILGVLSYLPAGAIAWRYRASRPRFFLIVDGPRAELLDAQRRPLGRTDDVHQGLEQWRWTWRHRYGASSGPGLVIRFGERSIELGCLDAAGEAPAGGREPRWAIGPADFALLRAAWRLAV